MTVKVNLQLYSILREKLPREARGYTELVLEDGAALADIMAELDLPRRVVISVNGEHEPNLARTVIDGDDIRVFSAAGGG